MEKHAIESIMNATMENIRDMVDVNTVIGEPVTAGDGTTTIIPISRVSFGFVAGGGEYELNGKKPQFLGGNSQEKQGGQENKAGQAAQGGQNGGVQSGQQGCLPFAGGAGAGVPVSPVGFLVVSNEQVRLLPAQPYAPLDRIIELAPQLVNDCKKWMNKKTQPKSSHLTETSSPPTGQLD
jgi:sporulation protein YtfJ